MTRYRVLEFCQAHDWGALAFLDGTRIRGLVEHHYDGTRAKSYIRIVSIPATLAAARDFGGY